MDYLQQIEDAMINAVLSIPIIRRSVNYVKSIPTHMVNIMNEFMFLAFRSSSALKAPRLNATANKAEIPNNHS